MPCTICQHPQRQAIDLALLHQTLTLAQLSRQYNLSQSALHRHKQHLLKKMALSQNRFQTSLREGCLVILYSFLERLIHITRTAAAEGNSRQVLQAVRQGVGIIKCMHKMDLNLDLDSLYRLLASPQWAEQGALLPTDLQFTAGSRQDLAAGLFSSCPEPASDQEQALEELADLHNLMSAFPASELAPAGQRQKAGKKAKKDRPANADYKQYHRDSLCDQNIAKLLRSEPSPARQPEQPCLQGQAPSLLGPARRQAPGRGASWINDLDAGRLDVNLLHAIGAGRPVDPDLADHAGAACGKRVEVNAVDLRTVERASSLFIDAQAGSLCHQ